MKHLFVMLLLSINFAVASVTDPLEVRKEKFGIASYYANKFEGRKTATGERFRQKGFTAASNFFPLHTMVKVTNLDNGDTIIVRINDRMALSMSRKGRVIDLSRAGADSLKYFKKGLQRVSVVKLDSITSVL